MEGVMIAALNHTGCDTTSLDRVSAHQQRAHDEKIAAAMKYAKDQRDTRVEPMRYPSEASLTPLPEAFAAEHHTTNTTSPSPSSSSSSSSSSRHRSTPKHVEHRRGQQQNRVMIPPQASDASEVPLEAFAEGEVLEMDHSDDHGAWDRHHSSDPFTAQQLRYARARCSSSTLFDDARPSSGQDGSWTYQPKKNSMDLLPGSPALAQHQQHPAHYRNTYDQVPKKQAIMFVDQATQQQGQSLQQPHHLLQQQHGFAYHRHGKRINDTVSSQAKTLTNGDSLSSTNSCGAESPSWAAGTRLKIEPSTPVRPASHGTHHSHDHSKGSSPLTAPTTPLTPTPAELDKPTKNLMIFNKIPRQWPASQETLHHNFVTKATKKTPVIKEFDSATAERIDRVINKERPLNRAAKERLAAEQKEAELEARGFFDPARRWKGRDAYPRPDNWVYCRRTKNNWLEKTKILVDSYKLFKGQVLGKGHHADVYKGVDLTTGQELAIKVIYKTVTRRLGFVNEDPMQEVKNRRLLNEAWFIDYLKDGPGICKMLRVVETATKFYFVMELAQSDLNSYSNGINMREEEIRHILRPIFECLKYAHSHDITHRDIKPENILLRTKKDWLRHNSQSSSTGSGSSSNSSTNNGKNNKAAHGNNNAHRGLRHIDDSSSMLSSTFANESSYMDMDTTDGRSSMDSSTLYNFDHRFDAFLADWGLAVEHDCNSGRKPVGTPLYAAPEVVRKMKRIRRREWINYRACDIWSLGVTMFVIASGIYPYHTHDALEAQSPPNWAALEASGMSREYIAFTQRLMNLTAELRPSATEACNDPWLQG